MRLWKVFFIISIAGDRRTQTRAILIAKPKNTVAAKGSRIELECRRTTNDATDQQQQLIDWEFTAFGDTAPKQCYFNGKFYFNFISKYEILRNENGNFNLFINSVDLSYAGQYICLPRPKEDNDEQSASAELIILDSDPTCKWRLENKEDMFAIYQIQCSVNYTGNVTTIMNCSADDGIASRRANDMFSTMTFNNITSANLTSYFNISRLRDVAFECNITFKTTHHIGFGDTFDYIHTWKGASTGVRKTSEEKLDDGSAPLVTKGVVFGLSLLTVGLVAILAYRLCLANPKGSRSIEPDIVMLPDQENVHMHVYEDVRLEYPERQHSRNTVREESNSTSRQIGHAPVYTEVRKEKKANVGQSTTEKENSNSNCNFGALEPEVLRTYMTTTGADGTVYVEVNPQLDKKRFTPLPFNHQPRFNKVENYAFIDHSRKPPPPPPSLSF